MSQFQSRHMVSLAAFARELPRSERASFALTLARFLSTTNDKFDRKRFLTACNVFGTEIPLVETHNDPE